MYKIVGKPTEDLTMKKIWKNEEGVSPVIAVILMVAITVVLAAVLYVMVSGMLTTTSTTPTISMNWQEDDDNPGNYTGYVVSISGATSIRTDDVSITVTHSGASNSETLDVLSDTGTLVVGDLTLDYEDLNPTGKLGAEDQFSIIGGDTGDGVRLVYTPEHQRCFLSEY